MWADLFFSDQWEQTIKYKTNHNPININMEDGCNSDESQRRDEEIVNLWDIYGEASIQAKLGTYHNLAVF